VHWQPVKVIGANRACVRLARGHAQVVHHHADDFRTFSMLDWIDFSVSNPPIVELEKVHTPTRVIRLPRVILLTFFDKLPCKELKLTRNNVFERDKNTCQSCARAMPREQLNLDHVIPRDYGGKTTWENIVCSCVKCIPEKRIGSRTKPACDSSASPSARSGARSSHSCSATSATKCGRISWM